MTVSYLDRVPLTKQEQRLHDQVQGLIEPDQRVRIAVEVTGSGRHSTEVAAGLLTALTGWIVPAAVGVTGGGRFTLAVTDREVLWIGNPRRGHPRDIAARYPGREVIGEVNDSTGDLWVEFLGVRYYAHASFGTELSRLRRLLGRPVPYSRRD